jgi:hypothetical protein
MEYYILPCAVLYDASYSTIPNLVQYFTVLFTVFYRAFYSILQFFVSIVFQRTLYYILHDYSYLRPSWSVPPMSHQRRGHHQQR